ncbi:putative appr-1-p processing [Diplodia seriata]|uniref:Putative appr-1-p processing n=1 Tax=Diplodia seriata TaxID=420778 RepID=A0A0G2EFI9_9PEZI|nr:putative appr-1-p processing [Diplodia seriata]
MYETHNFADAVRFLEKIPHNDRELVFAAREFEHLIRFAQFAGPEVRYSIENSASWSRYFRMTNRVELQELLALTDDIAALCYRPGAYKNSPLYKKLEFLQLKHTQIELAYPSFYDIRRSWTDAVAQMFVQVVSDIAKDGPGEHAHFVSYLSGGDEREEATQSASVLARMWIPPTAVLNESEDNDDNAEAPFDPIEAIAFFNEMCDRYKPAAQVTDGQQPATNNQRLPTVAEMTRWVGLYNKMRRVRLAHQAAELNRIANLYEQHYMRLREPWAPQTPRHNPRHIVIRLRAEAKVLRFRSNEHGCGRLPCHGSKEFAPYRFTPAFAPVVPYDWCLKLFCAVLRRHPLPGEGGEEHGGLDGVYPSEMVEKVKEARDGLTTFWDTFGEKVLDPTKIETLRTAATPWSEPPGAGGEGLARFLTLRGRTKRVFPHCENELCWLEAFTEVIAWMEDRFPALVLEVRGEEWDKGGDLEAVKRQRKARKQRKLYRKYFPPAAEEAQQGKETETEAHDLAKRLPDPPTAEPELAGAPNPNKRQKTER